MRWRLARPALRPVEVWGARTRGPIGAKKWEDDCVKSSDRNGADKAVLADLIGKLEGSLAVLDHQGASLAAAHLSMVLDLMRKELAGPRPIEGIAGIPATIQSSQLH